MKKAIIAVPYLSGKGGTETVIKNFYDALSTYSDSKEWSWKLISFGGTKYSLWINKWPKKIYNFSNNRILQMVCYATLLPFLILITLKNERPDVFITTNPVIWSLAYNIKKAVSPKTKIIAWYHYSFKMKSVNRKYLKKVDRFWAISEGIKKELISLGVLPEKIEVVYNPVNTNISKVVQRSKESNHFVYIGRVDYDGQKNVSELIKALADVEDNWICDIYGSVDNKALTKLTKLKNMLKISNPIIFHGFSENVWDQIKVADTLILTSKYEGFGMVLCEAGIRGIPLVSSNCPMGPDEIVNSNNGYLYTQGNVNQLTKILNNIVSEKDKLPSVNQVIQSMNKFNYENYCRRIYSSLRRLVK